MIAFHLPGQFLSAVGGMSALALEGLRRTWDLRRWSGEFLDQCAFLAGVTILPVMPFLLRALRTALPVALALGALAIAARLVARHRAGAPSAASAAQPTTVPHDPAPEEQDT